MTVISAAAIMILTFGSGYFAIKNLENLAG